MNIKLRTEKISIDLAESIPETPKSIFRNEKISINSTACFSIIYLDLMLEKFLAPLKIYN